MAKGYNRYLEKFGPNGEHISSVKIANKPIEHFYMTFTSVSLDLLKITKYVQRKVLDSLCRRAEYNTNVVHVTIAVKEDIAEENNTTVKQVTDSLHALSKLNFISIYKGNVTINPRLYWTGETKYRDQLLKEISDKNLKTFAKEE